MLEGLLLSPPSGETGGHLRQPFVATTVSRTEEEWSDERRALQKNELLGRGGSEETEVSASVIVQHKYWLCISCSNSGSSWNLLQIQSKNKPSTARLITIQFQTSAPLKMKFSSAFILSYLAAVVIAAPISQDDITSKRGDAGVILYDEVPAKRGEGSVILYDEVPAKE